MSKKAKIITGIIVSAAVTMIVGYILYMMVIASAIDAITNNPFYEAAVPLVREDRALTAEYGRIYSLNRLVFERSEKTTTMAKLPYKLVTEEEVLLVYISFEKENGEWVAVSLEVIGPY